jgi:hypothetical protein
MLIEWAIYLALAGAVGLLAAAAGAMWWVLRARRIAWERYEQARRSIEQGTRIRKRYDPDAEHEVRADREREQRGRL